MFVSLIWFPTLQLAPPHAPAKEADARGPTGSPG